VICRAAVLLAVNVWRRLETGSLSRSYLSAPRPWWRSGIAGPDRDSISLRSVGWHQNRKVRPASQEHTSGWVWKCCFMISSRFP